MGRAKPKPNSLNHVSTQGRMGHSALQQEEQHVCIVISIQLFVLSLKITANRQMLGTCIQQNIGTTEEKKDWYGKHHLFINHTHFFPAGGGGQTVFILRPDLFRYP